MKKAIRYALFFIAGLLFCEMLHTCVTVLAGRASWHVGGEVIVLPLMALLVYAGWAIRDGVRETSKKEAYDSGYHEGIKQAIRALTFEFDGRKDA